MDTMNSHPLRPGHRAVINISLALAWFGLVAGGLLYLSIPWLAKLLLFYFQEYIPTVIMLYVGGLGAWGLIFCLLRILRRVKRGVAFTQETVKDLKRVAPCCALAAAALIFILFFRFSFVLTICVLILLFGLLCALVLAAVFAQAVAYKDENDLTV